MAGGAVSKRLSIDELRGTLIRNEERLRAFIGARIPSWARAHVSADDVLQEVWIRAHTNLDSFRVERPDSLDRWVTVLAQNCLLLSIKSELRLKRGGNRRVAQSPGRPLSYVDFMAGVVFRGRTPSGEVAVGEASAAVRNALATLPQARREAVEQRYIHGKSCVEIAETTQRTPAAVNSLLFHGLRQLNDLMGHAGRYWSDAPSADPSVPNCGNEARINAGV